MVQKHEREAAEYDKQYEQNDIGLKGILYFGGGLLVLMVVTFFLMSLLLNVMKEQMSDKDETGPMTMSDKERLPPEPRLQSAPGFGVDSPNGRVNLELRASQEEYREIRKEWDQIIRNGEVDPKTGMMIAMPIDVAKEKFLEENVKAKTGDDAQKAYADSRMFMSDSSAGRLASEKRR
jgi:hypothetical protein